MTRYRTKRELVRIPGAESLHIRSLLDRQQYDDPLGEAERLGISQASWPLFGLAWPSGIALAARLAQRPVTPGERILEVGCGLALGSLVGHRRGADVTASDCHPLAARFLGHNLRLNGLGPMKYRHGQWGEAGDAGETGEARPPGQGRDPAAAPRRFDLVIASDVLYEPDPHGRLAGYLDRHASADAQVWVVDPDRSNRSVFNRHMAGAGFGREEERLDRVEDGQGGAYKGRLMVYRRGRGAFVPGISTPD